MQRGHFLQDSAFGQDGRQWHAFHALLLPAALHAVAREDHDRRSNARNYRRFGYLDAGEITFGHVMKRQATEPVLPASGNCAAATGTMELSLRQQVSTNPVCGPIITTFQKTYAVPTPSSERCLARPPGTGTLLSCATANTCLLPPTTMAPTSTAISFATSSGRTEERPSLSTIHGVDAQSLLGDPLEHRPRKRREDEEQQPVLRGHDPIHGPQRGPHPPELETQGLAENTLVLFTCDNGTNRALPRAWPIESCPAAKAFPWMREYTYRLSRRGRASFSRGRFARILWTSVISCPRWRNWAVHRFPVIVFSTDVASCPNSKGYRVVPADAFWCITTRIPTIPSPVPPYSLRLRRPLQTLSRWADVRCAQ